MQVYGDGYYSVAPEAANILVAEAVNRAAKTIDYNFYNIKPAVFVEVAERGAGKGVYVHLDEDDYGNDVWRMYHRDVGAIGFHDPYGEIKTLITGKQVDYSPAFPWNGVYRQDMAFAMLEDPDLVEQIAEDTKPEFVTPLVEEQLKEVNLQMFGDDFSPMTIGDTLDGKTREGFAEMIRKEREGSAVAVQDYAPPPDGATRNWKDLAISSKQTKKELGG